jgi:hypothetical protein
MTSLQIKKKNPSAEIAAEETLELSSPDKCKKRATG